MNIDQQIAAAVSLIGLLCFWGRIEHRFTKLEEEFKAMKENCKNCIHSQR